MHAINSSSDLITINDFFNVPRSPLHSRNFFFYTSVCLDTELMRAISRQWSQPLSLSLGDSLISLARRSSDYLPRGMSFRNYDRSFLKRTLTALKLTAVGQEVSWETLTRSAPKPVPTSGSRVHRVSYVFRSNVFTNEQLKPKPEP